MKNPYRFYVYEHWRPDKDICFYVGKGRGPRAEIMGRRNPYHKAIQKHVAKLGMCVEVRMVAEGLTEDEAFSVECDRIAFWRAAGVRLANMTNGGEGVVGMKRTAEHQEKIAAKLRGRKRGRMSDEQRAKISAAKKGKKHDWKHPPHSAETREKIAAARRGKPGAMRGVPKSAEHKRKISETVSRVIRGEGNPFYGKRHSDETKKKQRAAKLGGSWGRHTPEARAKIAESNRRRSRKKRSTEPAQLELF